MKKFSTMNRKAPKRGKGDVHKQLTPHIPLQYCSGLLPSGNTWRVQIGYKGKTIKLGSYAAEKKVEAAEMYDKVALALHEEPVLNFLPDGSLNPDRKRMVAGQDLR